MRATNSKPFHNFKTRVMRKMGLTASFFHKSYETPLKIFNELNYGYCESQLMTREALLVAKPQKSFLVKQLVSTPRQSKALADPVCRSAARPRRYSGT